MDTAVHSLALALVNTIEAAVAGVPFFGDFLHRTEQLPIALKKAFLARSVSLAWDGHNTDNPALDPLRRIHLQALF